MEFRNPKVPEGINVSRRNPLIDLALLGGGAVAGFVAFAVVLIYFGGALARYVPVSWEAALARNLFDEADVGSGGNPAVRDTLQALAGRLSERMDLPDGMTVTVHYLDEDAVNAFASLGGHVFVFRGLIERMPSENALAMVLAHEIAHAANRDPAVRMGSGLLLQAAFAVVFGAAPGTLEKVLLGPNALVMRAFSREAEAQADIDAMGAVVALYGHAAGAAAIFEVFLDIVAESGRDEPPEILNSHPLSRSRIAAIEARTRAEGWPLEGDPTPLPPVLAALKAEVSLEP